MPAKIKRMRMPVKVQSAFVWHLGGERGAGKVLGPPAHPGCLSRLPAGLLLRRTSAFILWTATCRCFCGR